VHHPGCGGELIEIVPLALKLADVLCWLELETDPFHIVPLEGEHLLEILLHSPMLQLLIVEKHDA
jgi:hypothetical protein